MNPVYMFALKGKSTNMINPYDIVKFKENIIDPVSGAIIEVEGYVTDLIPIKPLTGYYIQNSSGAALTVQYILYDSNKEMIATYIDSIVDWYGQNDGRYIRLVFDAPIAGNEPENVGLFEGYYESDLPPFKAWDGRVNPMYGSDISIVWEKHPDQEFFRRKFSGKLTFSGPDYTYMIGKDFDYRYELDLYISYDRGQTFSKYWSGYFYKTDCEINVDDSKLIVQPTVLDEYTQILDQLEKEVDLVKSAPVITRIKAKKRACLQVYVPGSDRIGCFMAGMYWEQASKTETDPTVLNQTYKMDIVKAAVVVTVSGSSIPDINGVYISKDRQSGPQWYYDELESGFVAYSADGKYKFSYQGSVDETYPELWVQDVNIIRVSDNVTMYHYGATSHDYPASPRTWTLSGQSETVTGYARDFKIYGRLISDVRSQTVPGVDPDNNKLPTDDITDGNNYTYGYPLLGYIAPSPEYAATTGFHGMIHLSGKLTTEPTEFGMHESGKYFSYLGEGWAPVARNSWDSFSVWLDLWESSIMPNIDRDFAKTYTIKDNYMLPDAINAIFKTLGIKDIVFGSTDSYSDFLYGSNERNLRIGNFLLAITPKSNILFGEYDQAARKGTITLKMIFDMLRDCFRCYWFIENGKLRVEHIYYFMNGKTYGTNPGVGIDLTSKVVTRNSKAWSFASSAYKYDKHETVGQYTFGWMDEVTPFFKGSPIEILSGYVNKETVNEITINNFTSDVDYMLISPGECSQDGFALLGPVIESGEKVLPLVSHVKNETCKLQNGYLSFERLREYYYYDLSGTHFRVDGEVGYAYAKKLKKQEVSFPCLYDPDIQKLIKTEMGEGQIEKLTINLSSRVANATLKYPNS